MKAKMTFILLGLGLAYGVVYAAHEDETPMPVPNDVKITAPDQSGEWSVGATTVYMKPTSSTPAYAEKAGAGHDKTD